MQLCCVTLGYYNASHIFGIEAKELLEIFHSWNDKISSIVCTYYEPDCIYLLCWGPVCELNFNFLENFFVWIALGVINTLGVIHHDFSWFLACSFWKFKESLNCIIVLQFCFICINFCCNRCATTWDLRLLICNYLLST